MIGHSTISITFDTYSRIGARGDYTTHRQEGRGSRGRATLVSPSNGTPRVIENPGEGCHLILAGDREAPERETTPASDQPDSVSRWFVERGKGWIGWAGQSV